MTSSRTHGLIAAVLLASTCALTGCSSGGTESTPAPRSEVDTTTAAPSTPRTGKPTLGQLDPCGLLTDAQARLYGYDRRTPGGLRPTVWCTYSEPDPSPRKMTISFSDRAIGKQEPDPEFVLRQVRVGERTATVAANGTRVLCLVTMDLGLAGSVSVQGFRSPTIEETCRHAEHVAQAIEPKLP